MLINIAHGHCDFLFVWGFFWPLALDEPTCSHFVCLLFVKQLPQFEKGLLRRCLAATLAGETFGGLCPSLRQCRDKG